MSLKLNMIRSNILPIGVDIGSTTVKLAQLRPTQDGHELLAAGILEIPQDCRDNFSRRCSFLSHGIRGLLATQSFKSHQCILSLPAETTFVHHARLAKLSPQEIPQALQWELQGKLSYPVEEALIRHIVAGEVF